MLSNFQKLQMELKVTLMSRETADLPVAQKLILRQLYILAKWFATNPAFIVDFYLRILFLAASTYLKDKSLGKEPNFDVLEDILNVAEEFHETLSWTNAIFPHTRSTTIQIIQGIDQVIKRLETEREERRYLNRMKRLLEPIRKMSGEEVPLQISFWDIFYALTPFSLEKEEVVEFASAFDTLYQRVTSLAPFYRQILSRPVFREIERPTVEDLTVWKHYWMLLVTTANKIVTSWGWPSLPPIDVVIYTGTIIENIADSYAYTYKTRGYPPVLVVNMPIMKRGSSPADMHLVVHEVTPGHAFQLTFMEYFSRKKEKPSEIEQIENFEMNYTFLPFGTSALFYEGWATFAQWFMATRPPSTRYVYQWIIELELYLQRIAFLLGKKPVDSMHSPRVSNPLQLASYFFGLLLWKTSYNLLKDDAALLEYSLGGRFIDFEKIDKKMVIKTIHELIKEIENIEKTGKM